MKYLSSLAHRNRTNLSLISLLVIIIIGFWLRFSGIIENSFAFTYDVGRDLLAVREIVVNHRPTLLGATSGLEGLFYGPWWYYFLTIPFFLSSGNPQGIVSFVALLGLFSVFLAYLLGKKIGGESNFLGLTFASLIGFSALMITSSSQLWNPNLAPFFVLVSLFSLYQIYNQRKIYFLVLGFSLGLAIEMEIIFGVFYFLGIFLSVVLWLRDKFINRGFSFFLSGFLLIMSPRVLFELRHNFLTTRSLMKFVRASVEPQNAVPLGQRFLSRCDTFWNLWKDSVAGRNALFGLILLIFSLLALFLFYKKAREIEKFFSKTIVVVFLTFFIGLVFYQEAAWSHYLIGLPVIFIFFLAMTFKLAKNRLKSKWLTLLYLLVALVVWVNLNPLRVLGNLKKPLWEGDAAVYRNQLAVLDYVYGQARGEAFNYIAYTPPLHDYNYRYLFSWYGQKEYGYTPIKERAEYFFVILEPDYQSPQRLKDWLEVRKDDGQILEEKLVKGGIVVQTRKR